MIEYLNIIGKTETMHCNICGDWGYGRIIYTKQFSDSINFDSAQKCINCGNIQFSITFRLYIDEEDTFDEEYQPNKVGLDYISYNITESVGETYESTLYYIPFPKPKLRQRIRYFLTLPFRIIYHWIDLKIFIWKLNREMDENEVIDNILDPILIDEEFNGNDWDIDNSEYPVNQITEGTHQPENK